MTHAAVRLWPWYCVLCDYTVADSGVFLKNKMLNIFARSSPSVSAQWEILKPLHADKSYTLYDTGKKMVNQANVIKLFFLSTLSWAPHPTPNTIMWQPFLLERFALMCPHHVSSEHSPNAFSWSQRHDMWHVRNALSFSPAISCEARVLGEVSSLPV